jgi:hypothetical protein
MSDEVDKLAELEKVVGSEFMERLKNRPKFQMPSPEALKAMEEAEEACTCKHCGRCVLLGPPCCYQKLYDMYQAEYSEKMWLRKVQSKNTKKINELQNELKALKEKK